ncbi:MAG: hypothetical protein OFPII_24460 [Osedax symbiont Rs1]|nr:MAG: hypothetical protein OFPII_24460 [Osedax symbiont Rs1]
MYVVIGQYPKPLCADDVHKSHFLKDREHLSDNSCQSFAAI